MGLRGAIHRKEKEGVPGVRPILLALALVAVPGAARADLALRLDVFDGADWSVPRAHLDVPPLTVRGLPALALDKGGGAAAGSLALTPRFP